MAVYPVTFYHKHRSFLDALQDFYFVSFRALFMMSVAVSDVLPWLIEAREEQIIESHPSVGMISNSVASPLIRIWHIVRKMLVEARDSFYPCLLPGVVRCFRSKSQLPGMSNQKPTTQTEWLC